jgi:succinate dehydrogenase / fumarate reductase membrane anchor subunit
MSLESPLGKFLGHGSAKEGAQHWWSQRVSSVALLPLTIWFVIALLGMDSFAHADVVVWLGNKVNAILMILLSIATLHHSQQGMQVVIEDYIHGATKVVTLVASKLAHIAVGVAIVYSIIILSVGSA